MRRTRTAQVRLHKCRQAPEAQKTLHTLITHRSTDSQHLARRAAGTPSASLSCDSGTCNEPFTDSQCLHIQQNLNLMRFTSKPPETTRAGSTAPNVTGHEPDKGNHTSVEYLPLLWQTIRMSTSVAIANHHTSSHLIPLGKRIRLNRLVNCRKISRNACHPAQKTSPTTKRKNRALAN